MYVLFMVIICTFQSICLAFDGDPTELTPLCSAQSPYAEKLATYKELYPTALKEAENLAFLTLKPNISDELAEALFIARDLRQGEKRFYDNPYCCPDAVFYSTVKERINLARGSTICLYSAAVCTCCAFATAGVLCCANHCGPLLLTNTVWTALKGTSISCTVLCGMSAICCAVKKEYYIPYLPDPDSFLSQYPDNNEQDNDEL